MQHEFEHKQKMTFNRYLTQNVYVKVQIMFNACLAYINQKGQISL